MSVQHHQCHVHPRDERKYSSFYSNTVGICKQITILILFKFSYRSVTLVKFIYTSIQVSGIFPVTVSLCVYTNTTVFKICRHSIPVFIFRNLQWMLNGPLAQD